MALPYVTTTQIKKVTDKMNYIKEKLNPTQLSSGNSVDICKIDCSNIAFDIIGKNIILEDANEVYEALMNGTPIMITNLHTGALVDDTPINVIDSFIINFVWEAGANAFVWKGNYQQKDGFIGSAYNMNGNEMLTGFPYAGMFSGVFLKENEETHIWELYSFSYVL